MMNPMIVKQIRDEDRIISHITRVNYVNGSSKMIVPAAVIDELGLRWDDDYLEWKFAIKDGRKIAYVQRFRKTTSN